MHCPRCHEPMVGGRKYWFWGRKYWFCGACGFRIPRRDEVPGPAVPVRAIVEQLPSVLAIPVSEYLTETHPVQRLHRLCDATEILVRFLTIVALSELRRSLGSDPLPKAVVRALQPEIERRTFHQWADLLMALTEAAAEQPDPVVPELPCFVGQLYLPGLVHDVSGIRGGLVALAHAGLPSAGRTQEILDAQAERFELILGPEFLSEKAGVSLVASPAEGPARLLRGPLPEYPEFDRSRLPEGFQQAGPDRMLLVTPRGVLDLCSLRAYGEVLQVHEDQPVGERKEAVHLHNWLLVDPVKDGLAPHLDPTQIPAKEEVVIGNGVIKVTEVSLVELPVDAIACSRSRSLQEGSASSQSVHGAIQRQGGAAIDEEAVAQGPLEHGGVRVTTGGRLTVGHVVHVGVIDDLAHAPVTQELLATAVRNAITLCEEHHWDSLALPLMGTRVGGVVEEQCADVMFEVAKEYLSRGKRYPKVIVFSIPAGDGRARMVGLMMAYRERQAIAHAIEAGDAAVDPFGAVVRPSISDEAFSSQTVVTRYPAPVAMAYRRFCRQRQPTDRLLALFSATEALLRYLVTLGVSDFFQCLAQKDDRDAVVPADKAFDFLRHPRRMTLGLWADALCAVAKALSAEDGVFISELPEVCAPGSRLDKESVSLLVPARNKSIHTDGSIKIPPDAAKDRVRRLRPLLEKALQEVAFIQDYPLGFSREPEFASKHQATQAAGRQPYRVYSCMGARVANTEEAHIVTTAAVLQPDYPFVCRPDGTGLMYVWPLLSQKVSEVSGRHTLYVFEEIDPDRERYLAGVRWAAIDAFGETWPQELRDRGAADHRWLFERLRQLPAVLELPNDEAGRAVLRPTRRAALVGRKLGRYRVTDVLGRGGFGTVYLAEDESGRRVAVKVLEYAGVREQFARFQQEVRRLQSVRHDGIITCHGSDTEVIQGQAYHWYSMDFALGGDLTGRIDERLVAEGKESGPWQDPTQRREVIDEFTAIVEAVAHLHGMNIVHRDLKPGNVLVMEDGRLCLSDFGLAKSLEPSEQSLLVGPRTSTGAILGTRIYMAPEQEQGRAIGEAADVYSLGVMLAELACGVRPDPKAAAHKGSALQGFGPLRSLPRALEQLILECTAMDPEARPPDARRLLEEFTRVVQAESSGAGT